MSSKVLKSMHIINKTTRKCTLLKIFNTERTLLIMCGLLIMSVTYIYIYIYIYVYISWTEQQCRLTIAVRGSLFLTIQICSLLLLSAYFKLRNLYLLQLRSHLCMFSELASSQELIKSACRESVSFIYGNFLPKRPPHI